MARKVGECNGEATVTGAEVTSLSGLMPASCRWWTDCPLALLSPAEAVPLLPETLKVGPDPRHKERERGSHSTQTRLKGLVGEGLQRVGV